MENKEVFAARSYEMPATLLKLVANERNFYSTILEDEYLFGTFFIAAIEPIMLSTDSEKYPTIRAIQKGVVDIMKAQNGQATDDHEKLRILVADLQRQYGSEVSSNYARMFYTGLITHNLLLETVRKTNDLGSFELFISELIDHANSLAKSQTFTYTQNMDRLSALLDLNKADEALLRIAFFSQDIESQIFLSSFFQAIKRPAQIEHAYLTMLIDNDRGVDERLARDALSEKSLLITSGVLHFDQRTKRLSPLGEFWTLALGQKAKDSADFFSRFIEPTKKKRNAGSLARLGDKERDILKSIIFLPREPNLNVLIHGSSKLDKVGFLADFLEENKIKGWSIKTLGTKNSDVPAICFIAQRWLQRYHPEDVLIITNTGAALSKAISAPSWMASIFGEDRGGKATESEELSSDERLLLENPVCTIWLTSSASSIAEENVGRFLYHAELKGGSRADRRHEVQTQAADLGISEKTVALLSKHAELGKEQIVSAARLAKLLSDDESAVDAREEFLTHAIEHSQKALGRTKVEELRESATTYDLDMINLDSRFPLADIIEALKKRPYLSLCMFGPPGTGKTAFAEYLAVQLDLPIIKKRASDLLSKYVGEAEQNIAAAFREARDEGAILFFDEGDSFLRDRRNSRHSWEITQVNELLQQMENHNGIFICATNLMGSLDAAALRRFTFKLNFQELSVKQRIKMFETESGIKLSEMTDSERDDVETDLTMIRYLTPGDFAVVKKQSNLMDMNLDAKGWITQLRLEVKAKMASEGVGNYSFADEAKEMVQDKI
jgi:SpoVK/Ycf46/Vps4 family AAA+-type ATPase